MNTAIRAVLFDIDGTLVDSNDAHADAWVKAFRAFSINVDPVEVRRSIGMGGDKLMPAVSGISEDSRLGSRIASRRSEIFRDEFLPQVKPLPGSDQLVAELASRQLRLVAASSAKQDELEPLLTIAGAHALITERTSSDDAEASKPEPDIIHAALQKAGVDASAAVMIGDTPYDVAAARSAGVRVIAFRSGGWMDSELAGAVEIFDGPADLLARLDQSLLGVSGLQQSPAR